jgi:hypothetical protein
VVEGLNSEGRRIATRYTIDVDGPVENLELAINPPVVVQGRVTVEDAPIPKGAKVLLDLQEGLPDISLARNAAVGEDGAFLLPDVNLDRYYVSMAGLPDGFFVKSIRLGKKDVLEDGADLTEKPEYPLEIVLGSNAATIRGSVAGAGAGATVVLAPASAKRRARAEFYRTSLTDQGGKFTFANLAPGDYTLFAWDDVENGAWMDPAFLKQVEAQGRPMKLRDGETAEVEVNAIP